MKLVRMLLLLSLFVVIACSCSRGAQVRNETGLTPQGIEGWLDSKMTAAPEANLTGKWDAGSAFAGGWGEGNFIQEKARFYGTLGMYSIKGVVNGSDVHFALVSNGRVYYTGVMSKQGAGSFSGKTAKDALVDSEAAKSAEIYPISFQKMQ
jgi:hypothetical protein